MVASALPSIRSPEMRLVVFLPVALLLHALLLLVPAQRAIQPVEALRQLSVSLQKTAPPPLSPSVMEESAPAAAEAPRPPLETAPTRAEPAPPELPVVPLDSPAPPAELSAARLLDLAGRREWNFKSPGEPRRLGEFQPQPLPRNWRPGIPREATLFDDLAPPDRVEIVDRWLAADGSHNVVINTPSGETYCGHAAAWSPTNPLLEPVMLWRPCGGGGKRSFRMPERHEHANAESDRR